MNEESLFFRALECESLEERLRLLDEACGPDAEKRERIEALLEIHESAAGDELLLRAQESVDETSWELTRTSLDFLIPSERKASLGRLDHFEVLRVIGVGGTSVVLEALDTELERIVAVKVLARELCRNAHTRERFNREARSAASLSHPNVARVLEVGEQNLVPYLVMEYVRGRSLQQRIGKGRPVPVEELCRIGAQIARGLSAIHNGDLIHRDIKPSNILLAGDEVKITDFGVAHCMDHLGLTRTGEIPGTPEFMSPEQAQCQDLDHRSDLFSLGAVLYTMATGRSPFQAATPLLSMRCVCDEAPPPVRKLNPEVPRWLAHVIQRLLEKSPEDRISTAKEVATLIDEQTAPLRRWKRASLIAACAGASVAAIVLCLVSTEEYWASHLLGGRLIVQTDDPQVEFWVTNPVGGRFPLGPEGAFSMRGPSEIGLPPGPFELVAAKDGEVVFRKSSFMPGRGDLEIAIDVPPDDVSPPPANVTFVRQTTVVPNRGAAPRVVSYQAANASEDAEGHADQAADNEQSAPQSILLVKHDESVGSIYYRTYLTFEIDRRYRTLESVVVLLTPIEVEGNVSGSTKFRITRLPDARQFTNAGGTPGDDVQRAETVEGAAMAGGPEFEVGRPVSVDVTSLFAAAGEVGGHVTLKVEIFAEQVDGADQIVFASHTHANEAYRPQLQIATHDSAPAAESTGAANAGISEPIELRLATSPAAERTTTVR